MIVLYRCSVLIVWVIWISPGDDGICPQGRCLKLMWLAYGGIVQCSTACCTCAVALLCKQTRGALSSDKYLLWALSPNMSSSRSTTADHVTLLSQDKYIWILQCLRYYCSHGSKTHKQEFRDCKVGRSTFKDRKIFLSFLVYWYHCIVILTPESYKSCILLICYVHSGYRFCYKYEQWREVQLNIPDNSKVCIERENKVFV